MAVGLASATATSILSVYKNVAFSAIAVVYVKLHTNVGDPGVAGAGNPSTVTTRNAVTWGTITGGNTLPATSVPAWTMTASETISYISLWDAATAGNFLQSAALTTPVPVINGSTLTLSSLSLNYTPLAA
jgi:hypothetical protein